MGILDKHRIIEKNVTLLAIFAFLVVSIGGIVQIAPLFWLENTIEDVEGMRPYSPLELAGRDIYVREGCYVCHEPDGASDARRGRALRTLFTGRRIEIRPPFQWGSKRTGPDLARVGGRYSDDWHVDHLRDAQSVVPESVMPKYGFLENRMLDTRYLEDRLRADRMVGCPTPTR